MIKKTRIYTLLVFLFCAASLAAQTGITLGKFIDYLSDRYQIDVAIDPSLLNQYQIDPASINEKNVVASLEQIFEKAGLEYYYLDQNQILLRRSNVVLNPEAKKFNGKVVDAVTGNPLPFAAVYTVGFHNGVACDEAGNFSIQLEDNKSDSIECSFLGYDKIRLSSAKSNGIVIRLQPQPQTVERITIVASAQHYVSGMKSEYNANYHSYSYTNVAGQDLHRSIQKLSGVTKSDKATAGIRGYGSDKTLTMVDNIPVLNTGHYYNIISGLNELYFDEFTLYKNQFPTSYGNALGGMIQFSSTEKNNATLRTTSNLLYSGAALHLPVSSKVTLKAGGRVSYLGINENGILASNFNQLRFESNSNNPSGIVSNLPRADFYDANIKLKIAPNTRSYFEINGLISKDNTQLDWENNRQSFIQNQSVILNQKFLNARQIANRGLSLRYATTIGKNYTITSDLYSYEYRDSFHLANENTDYINGNENKIYTDYQHSQWIQMSGFRTALEYRISEISSLKAGLDVSRMQLELNTSENNHKPLALDQQATQPAFFMEYLFRKNRWTLNGGFRIVQPSGFDQLYLQPQLSASFKPVDGMELKSSIAKRVQNFNQFDFETRFAQNLKYYYISQKDFLPLQQSTSYMLGSRFTKAGFLFDVEFWLNHSTGSQLFTSLNTGNRTGPPMPFNYMFFTGETTTKGIDFTVAYKVGAIKYSLAYTLSKATQQFNGIYKNLTIPSPDDRRHQLTAGADFKVKKWTYNTSITYLSGTPYLSFDKSRDMGPKDKSNRMDIISYLPPYVSLDAGINYGFQLKRCQLTIGATVSNLTNHTNIKFLQQTGEFDDKKNMKPLVTGNQSLMLGRFFNLHFSTKF